jgi:diguanylate cyclase (GGDEF)-like protein
VIASYVDAQVCERRTVPDTAARPPAQARPAHVLAALACCPRRRAVSEDLDSTGAARVLVVDDDAWARRLSRHALEDAGTIVIEARDGAEALECFERELPHVILMDVEMPRLNGFEACAAIRAHPRGAHVPIMMVTGCDDAASIERAYTAGATDFLAKPVNWQLLGQRVRYMLRGSRTLLALKHSEMRNRALVAAIPDRLFVIGEDLVVHEEFGKLDLPLLDKPRSLVGLALEQLLPAQIFRPLAAAIRRAAREGGETLFEFELPANSGLVYFESRFLPYTHGCVLAILRDVTERRRSAERIRELAYFDELTKLPNRQLFADRLAAAIDVAREGGEHFAVMLVDLDHFKRINDSLGHAAGDRLLCVLAERLRRCAEEPALLGANALISRLGDDEFAIVARGLVDAEAVQGAARRVIDALAMPLVDNGRELVITSSVGAALYPEHGDGRESLLKNADTALHRAKAAGRNHCSVYSSQMVGSTLERLDLESALRRAFDNGEMRLVYQVQMDLRTRRLCGVEALLRWERPGQGEVLPSVFVPIAEESALVTRLSQWTLSAALAQLHAWRAQGLPAVRMAVNISAAQFSRERVDAWIERDLTTHGLPASCLEVEITESLLMTDDATTAAALEQLARLGVRLAVDDFGTGYSSLAYLRRFAVDTVKIDRSFVSDIDTGSGRKAICGAIIAMAHRLGLNVVAEGVETLSQLEYLFLQGCDVAQGYFIARPLEAADAGALLRAAHTQPQSVLAHVALPEREGTLNDSQLQAILQT